MIVHSLLGSRYVGLQTSNQAKCLVPVDEKIDRIEASMKLNTVFRSV